MIICNKNKCTGCAACVNVCNHHCISMQEDAYGELHPVVDKTNCTECNLCVKTCPNNANMAFSYPSHCYAAWISNKEKRNICASGGVGTIISEYVIKNKLGIVFGTRYDAEFIPKTTYTETLEGLEAYKGSKYVQSIIAEDTFKSIRKFLNENRFVLYIGTPCQIAGLKTFLNKDYDNLITIDLICHGVCPTKYFNEEIKYLVNKYKIKNLLDIRFRGNDEYNSNKSIWSKFKNKKSNNFALTLWEKNKEGKIIRKYRGDSSQNYYLAGFLLGISMRENCYSCNYARPDRISDITIGDFIGLGKYIPFDHPKKNVSSVTTNTEKGFKFYMEVLNSMSELISIERSYNERLKYKPSLIIPFNRHPLNSKFRLNYQKYGYLKAIKKTLRITLFKRKCSRKITNIKHKIIKLIQ